MNLSKYYVLGVKVKELVRQVEFSTYGFHRYARAKELSVGFEIGRESAQTISEYHLTVLN